VPLPWASAVADREQDVTQPQDFLRRPACLLASALALASTPAACLAAADDAVWLPVRDQNPFALAAGLPLLPQPAPPPGDVGVEVMLAEANSQLKSFRRDPPMEVVFGAETRETRLVLTYALDADWTARASLGDEWIGVGFLDKPIQHFHDLIGAPQGYRGGRLGERPPVVRVVENGSVLYALDRPGQALAPLLLGLAREWAVSDSMRYGLSLDAKLATGSTRRLSDDGAYGVSLAAFGEFTVFDDVVLGARAGYLHSRGNDLLPGHARTSSEFFDVSARAPLFGRWSWVLQYDVHSALYAEVPQFLGYAGVFTIGVARKLASHAELMFGVSEDVPIAHTQDVSFVAALRF